MPAPKMKAITAVGGEFEIGEDAHVEQRARRMELPQHEAHGRHGAEHQAEHDDVGVPALALAVGDAGHQAPQADAEQREAQPVEGRDLARHRPRRHEHQAPITAARPQNGSEMKKT